MKLRIIPAFLMVMLLLLISAMATYAQNAAPAAADTQSADAGESTDAADAPPTDSQVAQFVKEAGRGENWLERGAIALLILLIAMTVNWIVMAIIHRTMQRIDAESAGGTPRIRQGGRRAITVLGLLANVAKWVIGIGAILWILAVMNVNLAPVLAGAGIVGIAFGFGAQTLVRDTISGFFLLIEGQYVVGDYVEVSGKFGIVEAIGLRVTVIKDLRNQLHYLPNGTITAVTVYEEHCVNYIVDIPIAEAADSEKATQVIQQVADDLREDFPRHLPMAGTVTPHISANGNASVRIPVAVFPTQDWLATEEFPARIQNALASVDIAAAEGRRILAYPDISRMPMPGTADDAGVRPNSGGRII